MPSRQALFLRKRPHYLDEAIRKIIEGLNRDKFITLDDARTRVMCVVGKRNVDAMIKFLLDKGILQAPLEPEDDRWHYNADTADNVLRHYSIGCESITHVMFLTPPEHSLWTSMLANPYVQDAEYLVDIPCNTAEQLYNGWAPRSLDCGGEAYYRDLQKFISSGVIARTGREAQGWQVFRFRQHPQSICSLLISERAVKIIGATEMEIVKILESNFGFVKNDDQTLRQTFSEVLEGLPADQAAASKYFDVFVGDAKTRADGSSLCILYRDAPSEKFSDTCICVPGFELYDLRTEKTVEQQLILPGEVMIRQSMDGGATDPAPPPESRRSFPAPSFTVGNVNPTLRSAEDRELEGGSGGLSNLFSLLRKTADQRITFIKRAGEGELRDALKLLNPILEAASYCIQQIESELSFRDQPKLERLNAIRQELDGMHAAETKLHEEADDLQKSLWGKKSE